MYNTLSIVNILIGIICGNKVASSKVQTSRQYWLIMLWPILVFTFTYGLRYGWLIDFNYYEDVYENINLYSNQQKGWLYDLLSRTGNKLELPFNVLVAITDAVIITCYCAFIRPYKKYAGWILPLFYFMSFMCSNFISFYPALTIFLLAIGIHSRLRKKFDFIHPIRSGLVYPILLLILAFGFHRAVIACLVLYAIVLTINLRPKVCFVLYAISFLFIQTWWIEFLKMLSLYANIVDDTSFSSYYNHYIVDAEIFFNSDGTNLNESNRSVFYIIRTIVANSFAFILYYRYRIVNKITQSNDKILEMATIGLVYGNIAFGVPVFSRIGIPFQLVLPVLYAVAVAYGLKSNQSKYKLMAWYIIIIQGYYYIITMYLRDTTYYFYVWDSVKRNVFY